MSSAAQTELAKKYYVDDLPGAAMVGARLNGILQKIEAGDALTALAYSFLETSGLLALKALTNCQIDMEVFHNQAEIEREVRIQKALKKADLETADKAMRAAASARAMKDHFAAMANDPVL